MSVKSKVKRLNKEIEKINKENIKQAEYISYLEGNKNGKTERERILENIIKFAITNHIGGLCGGMAVDWFGVDKMQNLKLDIEKNPIEHAYIMRVMY